MKKNTNHKSWYYRYDNRKLCDEVIKLIDNNGKEFIYGIDRILKMNKHYIYKAIFLLFIKYICILRCCV